MPGAGLLTRVQWRRRTAAALVVAMLVGGCRTGSPSPTLGPTPHVDPTQTPTASAAASSSSMPSPVSSLPAASEPPQVGPGILESRPEGWSFQVVGFEVADYPATRGNVYGPEGLEVPPEEGPGRIVLYETIPASRAYLDFRIDLSRDRGGAARSVTVNGQPAEVWVDDGTGELLLGWELTGKSEVLVANEADYTIEQLVESAESVADCCG